MKRYFIIFLCFVNLSDFVTSDISSILVNELVGKILNRKLINKNEPQSSLVCSNDPEEDMTVVS